MISVNAQIPYGRRVQIEVDGQLQAASLHALVEKALDLGGSGLKLVRKGSAVPECGLITLHDGDLFLVIPGRKAPHAQDLHKRAVGDDDEHDALQFQIPDHVHLWERGLALLLQNWKCPDLVLVWLFHLRPRNIVIVLLAIAAAPLAQAWELGPIYIICCIILAIFANLGQRRDGEASAYSIFNNFRRLPGQLDMDQVDQQIRQGHA